MSPPFRLSSVREPNSTILESLSYFRTVMTINSASRSEILMPTLYVYYTKCLQVGEVFLVFGDDGDVFETQLFEGFNDAHKMLEGGGFVGAEHDGGVGV